MKVLWIFFPIVCLIFVLSSCSDNDPSFETTLRTESISEIKLNSAKSGGILQNFEHLTVIRKGICWAKNETPTILDSVTIEGNGTASFSSKINDLEPNTQYYVRAYVLTDNDLYYGQQLEFTTLSEEDIVNDNVKYNGSIVLTSQDEVDDFASLGYQEITGSLIIKTTNNSSPISNLDSLYSIIAVGRYIDIKETHIKNLVGLKSLKSIGLGLTITHNLYLESIESFNALENVGENIEIDHNLICKKIDNSFNNLISVDKHIIIKDMNVFSSLQNSFHNLEQINADLQIRELRNLSEISNCFNNLSTVNGTLNLSYNETLKSINAFENITDLNNLKIYNAKQLTDISTLTKLESLGSLEMEDCNNIQTLNFLSSLKSIGNVTLNRNISLLNLNVFDNVTLHENSKVKITSNTALQSFSAFNTSTTTLTDIEIINHPQLTQLNCFNKVAHVTNRFILGQNRSLSSLGASFQNLKQVDMNFSIIETSLENLDNFSSIEYTEGEVRLINNEFLSDLNGLNNIKTIGDNFQIDGNNNLLKIDGMNNLISIGGDFIIQNNDQLKNLETFNNLTRVDGELIIVFNHALVNLDGLGSLEFISGLEMYGNDMLLSLEGLSNLNIINGKVIIRHNHALLDINLPSLETVNGYIEVLYNQQLTTLFVCENLSYISGYIRVRENYSLESIGNLESLAYLGDAIEIVLNTKLTDFCGFKPFFETCPELNSSNPEYHAYRVYNNAFNPTFDQIKNGECSSE